MLCLGNILNFGSDELMKHDCIVLDSYTGEELYSGNIENLECKFDVLSKKFRILSIENNKLIFCVSG